MTMVGNVGLRGGGEVGGHVCAFYSPSTSLLPSPLPPHAAVTMWDSFACAWDEVVDDLREADLISNRERDNLHFIRLGYGAQGVRPILLPLFWTAGQVQKVRCGWVMGCKR